MADRMTPAEAERDMPDEWACTECAWADVTHLCELPHVMLARPCDAHAGPDGPPHGCGEHVTLESDMRPAWVGDSILALALGVCVVAVAWLMWWSLT